MSVAGIFSSSPISNQSAQSEFQQFKQEFQKLGQDLQAGNLSAAQSDFATLQQLGPQSSTASTASSQSNPIAQEFEQLGQDLQAGNTTAAQQDFATIQQDFQNQASQSFQSGGTHRHHHHGGAGSAIGQLLTQLGQALQSGNLSAAQTAYSTLQQDFQNFAQNKSGSPAGNTNSSRNVSVSA